MNSLMDDRDDDVRLPPRGSERRSAGRDDLRSAEEQDREFTLSTGTVLGIFFALALVCAVFFGFGYTMGRKSGQATAQASAPVTDAGAEAAAKPSASAPAIQAIPGYLSQDEADAANRTSGIQAYKPAPGTTTVIVPTGTKPETAPLPPPVRPAKTVVASVAPLPTSVPSAERKPADSTAPRAVPIVIPPTVVPSAGSSYVQIAAVSHQEDADVLLSALKRRGYAVFTRPGDADKLIHVQVGPFATKKDADTMRQRLLGDGYNAIVK